MITPKDYKISNLNTQLLILLIISSCFTFCTTKKNINNADYLLEKVIIEDKYSGIEKTEIEKFIRQKPNRKILKIVPFHTWLYLTINQTKIPIQKEKRNKKYDQINEKRKLKTDLKNNKIDKKNKAIEIKNKVREEKGLKAKPYVLFKSPKLKDKSKPTWRESILYAGEAPVFLDTFQVKISKEQIKKYLFTKGFFYANVKDSIFKKERKKIRLKINDKIAIVIYKIKKSNRYTINELNYKIDDEALAYHYYQDTINSLIKKGNNYDADVLQIERERITQVMKNNGYFEFAQDFIHYQIDTNLNCNKINLTLSIKKISIKTEQADSFLRKNHTRYYINKIYVIPNYIALNKTGYTDTLIYDDVIFLLNEKFKYKKRDIANKIMFHSGEVFNNDLAEETYSKLSDLRVFKNVNLIFDKAPESEDKLNCTIQLIPVLKQNFIIESEVTNTSNNLGIAGSFVYQNKNLFKGAELLELKLRGGVTAQQNLVKDTVTTSAENFLNSFNTIQFGPEFNLFIPKQLFPFTIFKFQKNASPKTIFTSSLNFQKRPEFYRTLSNISYGFQFKRNEFVKQMFVPFEFSIVKAALSNSFRTNLLNSKDNFLINSFTDHITTVSRYTFTFNNQTSKTTNKLKVFHYAKIDFESGGNILRGFFNAKNETKDNSGSYRIIDIPFAQFLRVAFDYRIFKNIRKLSKLVFRATGGFGKPLDNLKVLPYEKSFFSGGPNSIRAWRARTIGPGSYNQKNDANFDKIGDAQLEFNIEYRFNIYKFLNGAWFLDAGNIWILNEDKNKPGADFKINRFYKEFATGSGFGLRADFSFFILRLDAAFKLFDPTYDENNRFTFDKKPLKNTVLNFGIGYPF
jgi:outer membrane protein assembly factor BamA